MITKNYLLILVIAVLLGFGACKYSPSGSNFIDSETEFTSIDFTYEIQPSNLINDTLFVSGTVSISHELKYPGKSLEDFDYWLDSDSLDSWASWGNSGTTYSSSPINLKTTEYENGFHTLHFKITTSSGRDNIANRLGAEFIVFRDSTQFYINNEP